MLREQRLRHALALRLERERTQLARWADRLPRAVPPALAAERVRLQRLAERLPAALARQQGTLIEVVLSEPVITTRTTLDAIGNKAGAK